MDRIDERTARSVGAFLDLPLDDIVDGARLPLMWHLFYFLAHPAQSEIGPDGHGTVGEPTPPGTRRMFAGGRVTLQPGLNIGDTAMSASEITADTIREGKSGLLRFVTHRAALGRPGEPPALIDERDIVYIPVTTASAGPAAERAPRDPASPPPEAAQSADVLCSVEVDPTLLFRFSALTYNAHRIHYDRDYARDVEGYPGLVVHGPLQAVLMANLAVEHGDAPADAARFSYRLVAPLFEHEGLYVTATRDEGGVVTQVMDGTGRVTAKGRFEA